MEGLVKALYLDTHVVVWLYAGRLELFPEEDQELMEEHELLISPIVALEIQYLYETGRIKEPAKKIIPDLKARIGLSLCPQLFEAVAMQALQESWTRDPFDRIITGHARLKNRPLLTKDEQIRKHYPKAMW